MLCQLRGGEKHSHQLPLVGRPKPLEGAVAPLFVSPPKGSPQRAELTDAKTEEILCVQHRQHSQAARAAAENCIPCKECGTSMTEDCTDPHPKTSHPEGSAFSTQCV